MTSDFLFERRGAIALATLNRPAALNALTLGMVRAYAKQLDAWEKDPGIRAVVLRGAGGRAFCAGGDVLAVRDAGIAKDRLTRDFFREEYTLNYRIARLWAPHVALLDGVTMGGGVGLSAHGTHRVATEKALFAMPETGIGLFPDVGGSHFLPRCPGAIGIYLGLSGARLKAADMAYCGLATHRIASARFPELRRSLESEPADAVLARLAEGPADAPLAALRATIDRCFSADSVAAILEDLARDGGPWARQLHAGLLAKAPLSLAITFRQLREGRALDFEDCLRMEYRLARRCMAAPDFYEGVRALLIDKDNQPRWTPARLDQVTQARVDACFAPLGDGELAFDE
jgi:enoyl-CoA hydratase